MQKFADLEFRRKWHRDHYKDFEREVRGRRLIRYRNRRIHLWFDIKKGICSECGKICRTSIHHLFYIPIFVWACTIELCTSCHMKKNENRTKFPKVIEGSRTCVDCGSYNTIMKRWKGGFAPQWYAANEEKTQWRCRKCWNRFRSFL